MQLIPQDRDMQKDHPDLLYHYTDGVGLRGMLETGNIWATNVRFLNDTKEGELPFEMGLERVQRAYQDAPQTEFMTEHLTEMAREGGGLPIYVASFSSAADSLSQWRGYGGSNQGYTIAFEPRELLVAGQQFGFDLRKVEYDDGSLRSMVDGFVEDSLAKVGGYPKDLREKEQLAAEIRMQMGWFAEQYKHGAFRDEGEKRLVGRVPVERGIDRIKFRVSTRGLVPYVELQLPLVPLPEELRVEGDWQDRGVLSVAAIGVGPGWTRATVEAVDMLCEQSRVQLKYGVYASTAPYLPS